VVVQVKEKALQILQTEQQVDQVVLVVLRQLVLELVLRELQIKVLLVETVVGHLKHHALVVAVEAQDK
jgi:hypothetical protein